MTEYRIRDITFADTAPLRIEAETVVDARPQDIWDVLVDDEAWPEWFGEPLSRVERTSAEQGVGATRRVTLGRGRASVTIDERFIVWEPGSAWGFTATSGPRLFRSLVERCTIFEEGPGRVRITYVMAIDPHPLARPLLTAARGRVRASLSRALQNLGERAAARDTTS